MPKFTLRLLGDELRKVDALPEKLSKYLRNYTEAVLEVVEKRTGHKLPKKAANPIHQRLLRLVEKNGRVDQELAYAYDPITRTLNEV